MLLNGLFLLLCLPSAFSIVVPNIRPLIFPHPKNDTTTPSHHDSSSSHSLLFSKSSSSLQTIQSRSSKPLGINCRGNHACKNPGMHSYHKLSSSLIHLIEEQVDDGRIYNDLEKIACVKGVANPHALKPFRGPDRENKPTHDGGYLCAYIQYHGREFEGRPDMVSGAAVKRLAKEIEMHGCHRCGSVPLHYPDNNDGSLGELTFNARSTACHGEGYAVEGVCQESRDGSEIVHGVTTGVAAIADLAKNQEEAAKAGKKPQDDEESGIKDKIKGDKEKGNKITSDSSRRSG